MCKRCYSKVATRRGKVRRCFGLNTAARQVAQHGQKNGHELLVGRQVGGGSWTGPPRSCGKVVEPMLQQSVSPLSKSAHSCGEAGETGTTGS